MRPRTLPAAWAGLLLGGGVLGVVVALFSRTLTPVLEIVRYADHVRTAIDGIARNVEGAAQLGRTGELAGAVPNLAADALRRLGAP